MVHSTPRLAKARLPCAPLENVIIGFKCQIARAATTQGSKTMYEVGRKSLLNNELTSRLTREFFVRGKWWLRQRRGWRDVNYLHGNHCKWLLTFVLEFSFYQEVLLINISNIRLYYKIRLYYNFDILIILELIKKILFLHVYCTIRYNSTISV